MLAVEHPERFGITCLHRRGDVRSAPTVTSFSRGDCSERPGLAERRKRRQLGPVADRPPRRDPADATAGARGQLRPRLGRAGRPPKLESLCAALRESSRWHGYRDPAAPAFLDYRIVDIVGLTEPAGNRDRNSARFPRAADGVGFDYGALYDMRLHDGLRLDELVERGLVNEVWLLADHTATARRGRPSRSNAPTTRTSGRWASRRTRGTPASIARRGSVAACASCSSTSPGASAARWRASATPSNGWRRAARSRTTSATSASSRCSTWTAASGCPSNPST